MKKTLLGAMMALAFVGSAQAANIPLDSFKVVTVDGAARGFGGEAGGAFGFELSANGHATGAYNSWIDFVVPVQTSVSVYADANGDNLLDDAIDTLLFSFTSTQVLGGPLYLASGQAYFLQTFLVNEEDAGATYAANVRAVSSVPVPAAAWLFGSALFGAGALRRKQQAA